MNTWFSNLEIIQIDGLLVGYDENIILIGNICNIVT